MFALGCIQAQSCHTGHCPTGFRTQDPLRQQALVGAIKTERVDNFHQNRPKTFKKLLQAAGLQHPRDITASHIVRRHSGHGVRLLANPLPVTWPVARPGALM